MNQQVDMNNIDMNQQADMGQQADMNQQVDLGQQVNMNNIDINNINTNNILGKNNVNKDIIDLTLQINLGLLIVLAVLTFIESMNISEPKNRTILSILTSVAIIGILGYCKMNKLNKEEEDYKQINLSRYSYRMVMAPLVLLLIVLFINNNLGTQFKLGSFIIVLILNCLALSSAYLGEKGHLNKKNANVSTIIILIALFSYIYITYMNNGDNLQNNIVFGTLVVLWISHCIFYKDDDEKKKMISYNILESGGIFLGILIWMLLNKTISI